MPLGYDIKEEDRNYDRKGITDEISRFSLKDLAYPFICINITSGIPDYITRVLATMKNSVEPSEKKITLYIKYGENMGSIGTIEPNQVRSIYSLFKDFNLDVYLNESTKLDETTRYALCD